jgi:MoxR-like ATPase
MSKEEMPIAACVDGMAKAREQIARVIVGQEEVVETALVALLCEGHVLFEGVPGLGKTLLVRTLADTLMMSFSRIQFTPDLMPSDVIGATMISQGEGSDVGLRFEPGPVFANVVLADEINRASPKTQSALLQAMQEKTVTVRGRSYPLPRPFLVLATQNPLEMEGTYPLPEAQIDRFFFKVIVDQPGHEDLVRILERTVGPSEAQAEPVMREADVAALQRAVRDVVAPQQLMELASRIVLGTQPGRPDSPEAVKRFVRYGAGPRGAQALVLAAKARALLGGRYNATTADLERCLMPALRHRIALNFEGQSEGVLVEELIAEAAEAARSARAFDEAVEAPAPLGRRAAAPDAAAETEAPPRGVGRAAKD